MAVAKVYTGTLTLLKFQNLKNIKDNGKKININPLGLDQVLLNMRMEPNIKERLKMENLKAKADLLMKTKISTRENGKMEKLTDREYLQIKRVLATKEIGRMMFIMEKVVNNGIITKSNIQVTSLTARRQAKVFLNLKEIFMKVISQMECFTVTENINLVTAKEFIKDNFIKI